MARTRAIGWWIRSAAILVAAGPLVLLAGATVRAGQAPAGAAPLSQTTVPTPAQAESLQRGAALRVPVFHARPASFKRETTAIALQPGEGMEYKYRLEAGESFLYSWTATAPVHVELHSEPDNAPRGYADSFDLNDTRAEHHGSYTAPYPGIHGWYWQNRTKEVVTVTLTSAGFYSESREFRKGQPVMRRPIN